MSDRVKIIKKQSTANMDIWTFIDDGLETRIDYYKNIKKYGIHHNVHYVSISEETLYTVLGLIKPSTETKPLTGRIINIDNE